MTATEQPHYRFVITLAAHSDDTAELACRVLQHHPGTMAIERLGHAGLNWIVSAQPDDDLAAMMSPQTAAVMAHVQPVIAGLAEARVIEAANWHSCRQIGASGEFVGGEVPLW